MSSGSASNRLMEARRGNTVVFSLVRGREIRNEKVLARRWVSLFFPLAIFQVFLLLLFLLRFLLLRFLLSFLLFLGSRLWWFCLFLVQLSWFVLVSGFDFGFDFGFDVDLDVDLNAPIQMLIERSMADTALILFEGIGNKGTACFQR